MCTDECKTILQTKTSTVVLLFKQNLTKETGKLLNCFYACYRLLFLKSANISYGYKYNPDLLEFASDNSFSEAVLLFSKHAEAGEIYEGPGSLKTILFRYFYNRLRGHLTTEKRLLEKKKKYHFDSIAGDYDSSEDAFITEMHYTALETALKALVQQDRQIIEWRHLERKSVSEIAALLSIDYGSAANRINRCMNRLKGIIKNENGYSNE